MQKVFNQKITMISKDLGLKKISDTKHIPVLLNEIIEGLNLKKGDVVFDGTLGGGSYSKKICEYIGENGTLVATDKDQDAIERAKNLIGNCKNCQCKHFLINEDFRNIDLILKDLNISKIQGFVLDLGLSSDQFELSGRGFSFQKDEPLLMTFGKNNKWTAEEIINTWDEENIADILFGYGEEKFSRRIAKKIVEVRKEKEIKTTFELVEIIKSAVPVWYKIGRKTNPATKTFQALRIAVNDELGALREVLEKAFEHLDKEGRMVIVSFHSLEDRIVKNFMRDRKNEKKGILINKKPIIPTNEEIKNNSRSRSAKLRIIQKII